MPILARILRRRLIEKEGESSNPEEGLLGLGIITGDLIKRLLGKK